jgi:hypothetical protein
MQIRRDDLTGPEIRALLEEHLRNMHELSPPESVHALDLDKLRRPDIAFWTRTDAASRRDQVDAHAPGAAPARCRPRDAGPHC